MVQHPKTAQHDAKSPKGNHKDDRHTRDPANPYKSKDRRDGNTTLGTATKDYSDAPVYLDAKDPLVENN